MGMEESYGCLVGTYARDKDAPVAVMCLCEAAAYCKSQGITLWDHMLDLYEKYGYYKEGLYTITLKGVTGEEKIHKIMSSLRAESLTQIDTLKVLKVRDYEKNTITDLATGEVTESGLPQSNVLYYDLEDGAWACVRHQEQSQRSSCTTESREQALMMQMQSLKLSRQHLLRSSTSWQSSISIIYSKYKKAPSGLVTGQRFAVIIR